MGSARSPHWETRNAYLILVGKHEKRRQLGRPSRRREDSIKVDIKEIVLGSVTWIHVTQDRDL
jgi:hypothetical protein